jgi:hypothetical protein
VYTPDLVQHAAASIVDESVCVHDAMPSDVHEKDRGQDAEVSVQYAEDSRQHALDPNVHARGFFVYAHKLVQYESGGRQDVGIFNAHATHVASTARTSNVHDFFVHVLNAGRNVDVGAVRARPLPGCAYV